MPFRLETAKTDDDEEIYWTANVEDPFRGHPPSSFSYENVWMEECPDEEDD